MNSLKTKSVREPYKRAISKQKPGKFLEYFMELLERMKFFYKYCERFSVIFEMS